jgi:carboxylesterase
MIKIEGNAFPMTAPAITRNYTIPTDRHSFEMHGSAPACLLLHGFTGDPREMRILADAIHRKFGFYIYTPLLPGHGGPPHLLHNLYAEDFLQAAREALAHVRKQNSQIVVVAYSMGAAIAAQMLAEEPVAAFVMIAPMVSIRNPLLPLSPLASRFLPWFYPLKLMSIDLLGIRDDILAFDPTLNLDDPETVKMLKNEIRFPVAITDELRKMQNRAKLAASRLTMPTLIVQGSADLTLNPVGARKLFERIPARDKQFEMIPNVDHDVVKARNPGNPAMVRIVLDWMGKRFGR